jgi:hypothetical protein
MQATSLDYDLIGPAPRSGGMRFRNWHRVGAAVMVVGSPEVTKGGFDMPSDDSALNLDRRCPTCREPMRVILLESGVPGLPPGMRRQMIKCSACELVTFHTFALEPER